MINMKKALIGIFLSSICAILMGQSCPSFTNNLVINTGYDYNTSSTISIGATDGNWMLVSDNDPITNEPYFCFTVPPMVVWSVTNTACQYISPFNSNVNQTNGTYNLKYNFCL